MRGYARIARMISKSANSGTSDKPVSPTPAPKRSPAPMISEEADRAIFKVQIRYAMVSFALAVLGIVLLAIVGAKYPHSVFTRHLMENRFLFIGVSFLWLIPFLIGQIKQSSLRLQYGRQYAEQQRWGTVVAALRSFTQFEQRPFDRTGEAHYLLAQAYDRLNRKDQARKCREWIRKRRASSEWARRIGPGASPAASTLAANRVKKAPMPTPTIENTTFGASPAASRRADRPAQTFTKPTRRKRF